VILFLGGSVISIVFGFLSLNTNLVLIVIIQVLIAFPRVGLDCNLVFQICSKFK
jgi:hypothetical protein